MKLVPFILGEFVTGRIMLLYKYFVCNMYATFIEKTKYQYCFICLQEWEDSDSASENEETPAGSDDNTDNGGLSNNSGSEDLHQDQPSHSTAGRKGRQVRGGRRKVAGAT
jgi:hypothetical protein